MSVQLTWIVENFSNDQGVVVLTQHIKDKGYNLIELSRTSGYEKSLVQLENQCVLFYGSINMEKLLKESLTTCFPISWCNPKLFECTYYWPIYKNYLFNDKYTFITLEEFRENKYKYFDEYAKDAMLFIRPSSGDKSFSGQLLDLQDFDSFFEQSSRCLAKESDIIVISTPKNIQSEFRFFVTYEKKIISKSCYKYQNKTTSVSGAPTKATELVNRILDVGVYPGIVFAIDVAQDEDGNFWLLEFNSFNSSGLYATDKCAIVDEVSRLAIKDYENLINFNDED